MTNQTKLICAGPPRTVAVRMLLFSIALTFGSLAKAGDALPPASTILVEYERSSEGGAGSSSSNGRQLLVETVVGETDSGTVFEYDWPRDEDGKAQSNFWYFPAKILRRSDGRMELLQPEIIEARIEQWLAKYKFPREVCGLWNHGGGFPFKVDCDPESVFLQIKPFDLTQMDIAEGVLVKSPMASQASPLAQMADAERSFIATFELDPEIARSDEAKQSLDVAQMLDIPLTRDQARLDASLIGFSGKVTTEYHLGLDGQIIRKIKRLEMTVEKPNEPVNVVSSVVTVTRLSMEEAQSRFDF